MQLTTMQVSSSRPCGSTKRSSSSNAPFSIVSPKIAPISPPLKMVTTAVPRPSSTPPATSRNITWMLFV